MTWTSLDIPPSLIEDSQEELRRYRRENTPLRKARRERIRQMVHARIARYEYERMQDERERRMEVSE